MLITTSETGNVSGHTILFSEDGQIGVLRWYKRHGTLRQSIKWSTAIYIHIKSFLSYWL